MTFSDALFLFGVIIITYTMLTIRTRNSRLKEKIRVRKDSTFSLSEARARIERDLRDAITSELLHLENTTREMHARLNNKMRTLDRLIIEADERIEEIQKHNTTPTPVYIEEAKSKISEETQTLDPFLSPENKDPFLSPENKDPFSSIANFDEIYALQDKGLSNYEIAEKTKFRRGEVDFILSLRRMKS